MKEYEAMLILKPDLQAEELNKVSQELQETIKKEKGEIVSAQKWSDKRPLAYELRVPATGGHVKYKDGIYFLLTFKINTAAIAKLNQSLKLNDNVLRTLITVKV
jgi:small subunit ribosomal protein S6